MKFSKQHILETSLELFLKSGYSNVTIKDIIQAAGVSKGAFYHYFASKEDCFEQCVRYLAAPMPDHVKVDGTLEQFLQSHDKGMNAHENMTGLDIRLLMGEAVKVLPQTKALAIKHRRQMLYHMTAIVQRALDSGEIASELPAENLAEMFIYLSEGALIGNIFEMNPDIGKQIRKAGENFYNLLKKKA